MTGHLEFVEGKKQDSSRVDPVSHVLATCDGEDEYGTAVFVEDVHGTALLWHLGGRLAEYRKEC